MEIPFLLVPENSAKTTSHVRHQHSNKCLNSARQCFGASGVEDVRSPSQVGSIKFKTVLWIGLLFQPIPGMAGKIRKNMKPHTGLSFSYRVLLKSTAGTGLKFTICFFQGQQCTNAKRSSPPTRIDQTLRFVGGYSIRASCIVSVFSGVPRVYHQNQTLLVANPQPFMTQGWHSCAVEDRIHPNQMVYHILSHYSHPVSGYTPFTLWKLHSHPSQKPWRRVRLPVPHVNTWGSVQQPGTRLDITSIFVIQQMKQDLAFTYTI